MKFTPITIQTLVLLPWIRISLAWTSHWRLQVSTSAAHVAPHSTARFASVPRTSDDNALLDDRKPPQAHTTLKQDNRDILGKYPFGKTISNKNKIFDEIDAALGVDKPPDIEVVLTDHSKSIYCARVW